MKLGLIGFKAVARVAKKCQPWVLFLSITLYCAVGLAVPVRIEGLAQYEFVNYRDDSTRVIASSRLVIVVDGPRYRISTEAAPGISPFTLPSEGTSEEYGCDGADTFLVTDRTTIASRGKGKSGMIVAGRFPVHGSGLVQAAWLGYCSDGYFEDPASRTNLGLAYMLTWVNAENVTNQLQEYWPNSRLPKEITGWSRNLVKYAHSEPQELKYYPGGWKEWQFVATNEVVIGNRHFPRSLLLKGFAPRSQEKATTGDDTALLRRISFVATSITLETNSFDTMPVIPCEHLPVFDRRFEKVTAPYFQIGEVSPGTGWPTRSSTAFKLVEADASELARRSLGEKPNPRRATAIIWIFCVGNLTLVSFAVKAVRRAKHNNNNTQLRNKYENALQS